ncbi:hypothetical protein KJ813_02770 [bacterium]|nr:hypothetical protein [bacterium]MBU4361571.1 hypothetical protein [bacterium]MBU4602604.1 hypothetical protein [bacterium]
MKDEKIEKEELKNTAATAAGEKFHQGSGNFSKESTEKGSDEETDCSLF